MSGPSESHLIPSDIWCALHALNTEYWCRVDRVHEAPVDDLYVEDGLMHIGTLGCIGRPAIRAFFAERSIKEREAKRTTRHSASSLSIVALGADRWRVRSTVQVLSGNGDWPMTSAPPSSVGDFDDVVVRLRDGNWRYQSRSARIVFVGAGAAAFAR